MQPIRLGFLGALVCCTIGLSAHDLADGEHTLTLPDGSTYEGDILDGALHGNGKLNYRNGDVFAGRFQNGVFHGEGTYRSNDGGSHHGFFDIDGPSGSGVIQFANGDVYEGEWSDWEPHGEGTYTTDETTYTGKFIGGLPAGEFEIKYAHGALYRGGYKNWMYEGKGEYIADGGTSYSGTFTEGEFVGNTSVTGESGDTYVGELVYWEYSGKGLLQKINGDYYEGEFSSGKYHGVGSLVTHEGKRFEGEFSYGRFHGEGTFTSADGDLTLSGSWKNGYYVGPDAHLYARDGIGQVDIETVIYDQPSRLTQALSTVPSGVLNSTELYSLVFAPYSEQDVFKKEAEIFHQVVQDNFTNEAANIQLINNRSTVLDTPLATSTNLSKVLYTIGQRMNVEEDILLLYVTSHGSREGNISVRMPDIRLANLTGKQLAVYLDDAGIKWRIIIVSACYSGSLIPKLANDTSLIMTSARADRTSFGCSEESDATFFGKALLQQSLPTTKTLENAFYAARKLVRARETDEKYANFSEPQIHFGRSIRNKLQDISLLKNTETR